MEASYQLGLSAVRLTVDDSRASIRAIGSGRRTIEVTYHQYGTARSMSSGKASVVTIRRVVDGFTFLVISAGVTPRLLLASKGLLELAEPIVDVDMMQYTIATGGTKSVTLF